MPQHVPDELFTVSTEEAREVGELVANILVIDIEEARKIDLRQVASGTAGIVDPIGQLQAWLADQLNALVSVIVTPLSQALETAKDWLYTQISNAVSGFVDTIINTFNEIIKPVSETVNTIWTGLNTLISAIGELSNTFLEGLAKIVDTVTKGFTELGSVLTGFVNAIMQFPNWFPEWFQKYISEPIANALSTLPTVFAQSVSAVIATIVSQLETLWRYLSDAAKFVWDKLVEFGAWVAEKLVEAAKAFYSFLVDASASFESFVKDVFTGLFQTASAFADAMKDWLAKALRGEAGELDVYIGVSGVILSGWLAAISLPRLLKSLAGTLRGMRIPIIGVSPAYIAYEVGDYLENLIHQYGRHTLMGWALVAFEPLRYVWRGIWKRFFESIGFADIPFALPELSHVRDVIRRSMVWVEDFAKLVKGELPDAFRDMYERAKLVLEMRGFPTWFIEYWLDLGQKYSMTVKDRFGTERLMLLGPVWTVPTHSEAVRMLQRDVFQSPMEWARFVRIYGWSEDLAKMYYMLSFKYPSFRDLWAFLTRGIAGMLWYRAPDFVKRIFEADAKWLGAGTPVDPYQLNYDYNALFSAVNIYAKWIQMSNFSWFRKGAKLKYGDQEITIDFDWTADSWLTFDITADIPGKIDARWMVKWGLFDHLTLKIGRKVGEVSTYPEEPFVDLVLKVLENQATSNVVMDLRPFCRLLVANGLHPAWVPLTAVAEAINALADERTLLRTGFINLFKEGFFSYETLDKLLEGFVVASFIVEYFDVASKKWVAGAVNVPVRYLPAERRLLELRAVMDRALDILRDFVRELARAYREYIIRDVDGFVKLLVGGVETVNTWFRKLMKDITGKELALVTDLDYWRAYAVVLQLEQQVYTIHRMRYWASRYIGWILYRLAYGYVSIEDAKKVIELVGQACMLTPQEIQLLEQLSELLMGIARREYIPTPSQLATIAEVVPEARELFPKVVEARNIPAEWAEIWWKYVQLKPLVDDVRRYLSVVEDLYQRGLIDEDALRQALDAYKQFGLEDFEIEIKVKTAQLERAKQAWTWLVGTPRELVTMAEYSPKARKLALTLVNKLIESLPVDDETKQLLKEMWEEYIRIRPVSGELSRFVTELISDYAEGIIDDAQLEQDLEFLKKWGYDDYEIELIREIAKRRRMRRSARYGGP